MPMSIENFLLKCCQSLDAMSRSVLDFDRKCIAPEQFLNEKSRGDSRQYWYAKYAVNPVTYSLHKYTFDYVVYPV